MYGFHKLPRDAQGGYPGSTHRFSHPKFLRDRPDLLGFIRWGERPNTIPEDHRLPSPLPVSSQATPQPVPPILSSDQMLDVDSVEMASDSRVVLSRPTGGSSLRPSEEAVLTFPQMLYKELNGGNKSDLIWWSEKGNSFTVSNSNRFEQEVLAKWPMYNKWSWFRRELTNHGFCEAQEGLTSKFCHPRFLRDHPDQLFLIQPKRRQKTVAPEDFHLPSPLPVSSQSIPQQIPLNSPPGRMLDVNLLSDRMSAIERRQEAILSQLNELRKEVMASRERHEKHQDMIDRITKPPAGVFGSIAAPLVSRSGSTHGTSAHITSPTPSALELLALIDNYPESAPPPRFCASIPTPSQTIPPVPNTSHPTNSTAVPQFDSALLFNTSAINASDTMRRDVVQGIINEKSPQSVQMLTRALRSSGFLTQPPSSSAQPITIDNNQPTTHSPVQLHSNRDHQGPTTDLHIHLPAPSSPTGVTTVAHSSLYPANPAPNEFLRVLSGQDTCLHGTREGKVADSIDFMDLGIELSVGRHGFGVDNRQNCNPPANITGSEATNLDHASADPTDFDLRGPQHLMDLFPGPGGARIDSPVLVAATQLGGEAGEEDRERDRQLTTSLDEVASDTDSIQQLSLEAPFKRARKKKKSDAVA